MQERHVNILMKLLTADYTQLPIEEENALDKHINHVFICAKEHHPGEDG